MPAKLASRLNIDHIDPVVSIKYKSKLLIYFTKTAISFAIILIIVIV
jgi:hypothetical protein